MMWDVVVEVCGTIIALILMLVIIILVSGL